MKCSPQGIWEIIKKNRMRILACSVISYGKWAKSSRYSATWPPAHRAWKIRPVQARRCKHLDIDRKNKPHTCLCYTHIINVEVFRYSQLSWTFFLKKKKIITVCLFLFSFSSCLFVGTLYFPSSKLLKIILCCCYFSQPLNRSTTFKAFFCLLY